MCAVHITFAVNNTYMILPKRDIKQIETIENAVCSIIGVRPMDIINRDKTQAPTVARNLVWYILHNDYRYSGNQIANIYLRKSRVVWNQIADIKYKIGNCLFYTELYNRVKESLSDK